jgi:hypothetical protein
MNKKPKNTIARLKQNEEGRVLEKLEAGLAVKIGDKNINDLYNEKLHQQVDLTETISQSIIKAKKNPKPKKPVKEVSVKGKQGTTNLSKYRQQVKEALELKKSIDNKNVLSYSDDDDEADDQYDDPIAPRMSIPTPLPVQQPQIDLAPIFNELESIRKKNKELEDRFTYRSSILDLSNLRRNMSVKF